MSGSVIVSSARTPIGKLSGALASFTGPELGGAAIAAALERAGIRGDQVDHVILGQVLQGGAGQVPARQAAVKGGVPMTVPSKALNSACLSGMDAIYQADQMIQAGDADVVVAGGMESMTQAPYLLKNARGGYRMGNDQLFDSMISDGLTCALDLVHMGEGTERDTRELGTISREMQDDFASKSHERPGTTPDSLAGLRAAFAADGTVTAGNASQISDGAAAVVVMSRAKADELGVAPLAELVSFATVAGPGTSLLHQPANSIRRALAKADLSLADLELLEMNEAFASVVLASMMDLGVTDDIVNVNGGAVALGHPVGASGARIVLTLVDELRRSGGGAGSAALCGGGGQGEATIIRTL